MWLYSCYKYVISNIKDDGEFFDDNYFYPSDFDDDISGLGVVEEFLQNVYEVGSASIGTSTFQETYSNHWIWNQIMMRMKEVMKY